MARWQRLQYLPSLTLGEDGKRVTGSPSHINLSRRAASEGAVLLKNDSSLLPLSGVRLAPFGKGIYDYVKGGGGSGDVTVSYVRNIMDALLEKEREGRIGLFEPLADYYSSYVRDEYAGGGIPGLIAEAEFPDKIAREASRFCDVALIVISRYSGENWDRFAKGAPVFSTEKETEKLLEKQASIFEKGDFYLSAKEEEMVSSVVKLFENVVVVLNAGGVMDVSWIKNCKNIKAAIHAFQGGMEGGSAVADLLVGNSCPSGRLTDTYAYSLEDYPSTAGFHEDIGYVEYIEDIFVGYRYFSTIPLASNKVCYPFGYGLSYTSFILKEKRAEYDRGCVSLTIEVENTGAFRSKDVIEIYTQAPDGKLDKPARVLSAFKKTVSINPYNKVEVDLNFLLSDVASYDDEGLVSLSSFVLERGDYTFYVTDDGLNFSKLSLVVHLSEDVVVSRHEALLQPSLLKKRMKKDGSFSSVANRGSAAPLSILPRQSDSEMDFYFPAQRAVERRREFDNCNPRLIDVAEKRMELDDFIAALDLDTLIDLAGGQVNTGVANTCGFGNQSSYGIVNAMTADGPAGLRIKAECGVFTTAWPCACLLASSWDEQLVEEVGRAAGSEVKENNIAVWLTPAVNIHRSPLCGRNFEYYSEDPLLSGKIGAAMVRGIESNGIGACVKHFAFNNKETNRKDSDSRVSERAAREIYLKQFEIIVKEASPVSMMCSYNLVNGIRVSENHELLTKILREDWGYEGLLMTDWWTHGEHYLELLAGIDLKMATGFPERLRLAYDKGAITRKDLENSARHLLGALLRLD